MKYIPNTVLTLLLVSYASFAQEEVHSDVEFSYVGTAIQIEPGSEGLVFEGEFGEGAFADFAAEPGLGSDPEEGLGINAGNVIGFNVLSDLFYWNGDSFASPGNASISIRGAGGAPDTFVTSVSGIQLADFTTPRNLLGQADANGAIHVDPGFSIDNARVGAYGLLLSLATDDAAGIADSDPFGILLNYGLEEPSFEAGVDAFREVVPEPSLFPATILFVVIAGLRRRSKRSPS